MSATDSSPAPAYVFDTDRLATLVASRLLVDGPEPEPEFDRYSRIAAALTGAPIARLSLVDGGGQHFKSAVGPLPASGRSTPLSHAICKHVVGERRALVIDDATVDPLVAGNGAVTEDGTGAYLGIPVFWPDGHALGAFCVADTRPRAWTTADRAAMEDLAAAVNTELELRAALSDARQRAYRDALTGLPNRRQLALDLDAAFASGAHSRLVMLDLDGFKGYNDRYGHHAGDQLLVASAGRLRETAAAAGGRAYRMSGDEFCVLAGARDTGDLAAAAARALSTPDAQSAPVGASAGAVLTPAEADTRSGALGLADERMYAAKRTSRLSTVAQVTRALRVQLELYDPAAATQTRRAATLAAAITARLGLGEMQSGDIAVAAELADIGLLSLPARAPRRAHPLASESVLGAAPALAHLAQLVRAHHERTDGSGYPDGLRGDEMPLAARALSACIALAALTHPRDAAQAISAAAGIERLRADGGFDPTVLAALGDATE